ncbi:nuclear transport factor 2 family protein [Actinomadura madurae]|uniref:nuclear transport factor 2 family protein n=1 Tax=Actinomadura madurae TaxID=1993 RepID=UPI0020271C0C|nr:nuclear transport factor 2 family protein [Actinomadura madurae]MCP9970291.1 nuclear transport factor 2 family protein [Actinomadura madurae]MCP9982766.1 nuclear transport factor 2 family protein [Actinomadura madurae]MCQ0005685.1 nuclear transport factor 2 family protein [Actinomadura madurae]MCQ0019005.1 nuclear transport factor 2 family protein [Actinomadura madurae]URM99018.1 nuclear transport factor 2 family protein [Actinomadura madurae]
MPSAETTELPDSALTREEVIARNLKVVEAHFHNETPETIDKALELYGPGIVWEAPARGMIYTDPADVKEAYLGIFRTVRYHKLTTLRRFATENIVFDDQVGEVTIIGEEMPNLPYPPGTRLNARVVHCFEMTDGKITREIVYELFREYGSAVDNDVIPADAQVQVFP